MAFVKTPLQPSFGGNIGRSLYGDGAGPAGITQPVTAPTQNPISQVPGLQQGLGLSQGIQGPALAINEQQAARLAGQLGMTDAAYGTALGALNQGAAADLAKLSLGPQYDAIERSAIYRQIAGLNDLDRLAFQALGNQYKGFDIQKLSAWQEAARNQEAARSSATARGAMTAPGIQRTFRDIQHQLANQLGGIEVQRESARLGALEGQMSRTEQKAKLADRNKALDIKAKEYGIDASKISANLSQGLAKLGLDRFTDINSILDALNSNDLQRVAIAEQIFRDALSYSDLFATPGTSSGGATTTPNPVRDRAIDEFTTRGATG